MAVCCVSLWWVQEKTWAGKTKPNRISEWFLDKMFIVSWATNIISISTDRIDTEREIEEIDTILTSDRFWKCWFETWWNHMRMGWYIVYMFLSIFPKLVQIHQNLTALGLSQKIRCFQNFYENETFPPSPCQQKKRPNAKSAAKER